MNQLPSWSQVVILSDKGSQTISYVLIKNDGMFGQFVFSFYKAYS